MNAPAGRLLLVTAEYPPAAGGIGDYTARLAGALVAAGQAVAVLTERTPTGHWPTNELPAGVPVLRQVPNWGWPAQAVVERVAREWAADIIHLQYQTGAYGLHPAINLLPWWLARRGAQAAVATTFHDLRQPYLFPKAGRLRRLTNELLARHSRLTIATNPADYRRLAGLTRQLALVPIGANIEPTATTEAESASLRASLALAPNELLLVSFGLFNHSKGLNTLLAALARLNAASSVGRYRLALVGAGAGSRDPTDRSTAAELVQLAERLGLRERLIWTGARPADEVAAWLRAADAVALPYRDGASYRRGSLLAALACGGAVVTTTPGVDQAEAWPTIDAAAEPWPSLPQLRSGDQVLLVAPEEPAALATALAAAAGDRGLNRSLRRGGQQLAAHFSWPSIAARTLAAYTALIGRRP